MRKNKVGYYEGTYKRVGKKVADLSAEELVDFADALPLSRLRETESLELRRSLTRAARSEKAKVADSKKKIKQLKSAKASKEEIKAQKEIRKHHKQLKRELSMVSAGTGFAEMHAGFKQALWSIFGFIPKKICQFRKDSLQKSIDKHAEKAELNEVRLKHAKKRVEEASGKDSLRTSKDYKKLAKLKAKEEKAVKKQERTSQSRDRKLKAVRDNSHRVAVIETGANGLTLLGATKVADKRTKVKSIGRR